MIYTFLSSGLYCDKIPLPKATWEEGIYFAYPFILRSSSRAARAGTDQRPWRSAAVDDLFTHPLPKGVALPTSTIKRYHKLAHHQYDGIFPVEVSDSQ